MVSKVSLRVVFGVLFALLPGVIFGDWKVAGDLLYWTACEQGLGYTNEPADVLVTDNFTENSVIDPKHYWEWGYRIGAEYTQPCVEEWTYQGYWTYLKSSAHGETTYNSGPPEFMGIYPIWSMGPDTLEGDYVSSAREHWHLYTNIFDLNVQFNCPCFCNGLGVKPFLGGRGVMLNQRLVAEYEGGTFFSGVDVNKLRSNCFGAGPRFGFNADYCLGCGIEIFGRAAIAPIFGQFRIKQRENYLDSTRFRCSLVRQDFLLSTDYEIGLRWRGTIMECGPFATLGIAWEWQEFFWSNRFYRGNFHFFSKDRSLFMQGLTLNVAIDF